MHPPQLELSIGEGLSTPVDQPAPRRSAGLAANSKLAGVVPASRLERPPVPVVSCGVPEVDSLTGGLPRGALTEICGPASSGRSSLLLAALAAATRRQELCALVDASDCFDPYSAIATGIQLERLLWIRCGQANEHPWRPLEQALKATDLLLQGGGFGLVAIDMASLAPEYVRRVPLASWFRFRRAVEPTPTVLLVLEQEPFAKTCASLVLRTAANMSANTVLQPASKVPVRRTVPGTASPTHGQLFAGLRVQVEVVQARGMSKKPVASVNSNIYADVQEG